MPQIYKDFARGIAPLNFETGGPHCVSAPGGRGYLRGQFGEKKLYLDQVHWRIHDEQWFTQESLSEKLAEDKKYQGRVYAGCAGKVNLDYISAIKAPAAILFDINPLQKIFWDGLIDLIAAFPNRHDFAAAMPDFVRATYYKIENMFGVDLLQSDMRAPSDRRASSLNSLIRGMKYGDKFCSIQKNTQYISYIHHEWVSSTERYRHIHLMAKHRAIATLTLDIRDDVANARLAEILKGIPYTVGNYGSKRAIKFEPDQSTGAAIGFLYRSNVCYYMRYTSQELRRYEAENRNAFDYSRLPADTQTYRKAFNNIKQWMQPESHMISSDVNKSEGQRGQFIPSLTAVRGFAPA